MAVVHPMKNIERLCAKEHKTMNVCSEKLIYQDYFADLCSKKHSDLFLWGEDLTDKHLLPYAGKLTDLPAYKTFSGRLIICELIIVYPLRDVPLKSISSHYDELSGRIYITKDNFNAIWKTWRKSILLGIRIAEQTYADCPVKKPEDIVVLDCLHRTGSTPVLENHRIVYKPKELSPEEKRLIGARQSALANRKNLYFYSKTGGDVHDRDCYLLKKISNADFIGSETHPADLPDCPHCLRTLLLRIGCSPNTKEIPFCNQIFTKFDLRTGQLKRYVMDEKIHFHARSLTEMTVTHGEDTWLIKIYGDHLNLWHNNYVKTSETERYLTSGFHNQGIESDKNVKKIMNYIVGYTWQKHLNAEKLNKAVDSTEEEMITAKTIDKSVAETAPARPSLRQRLIAYIKRMFRSVS